MSTMKLLLKENFLAMLRASVGTSMYRHLYASVGGRKKDLTEDGNLSCALYVTSLLYHFGLVKGVHATVAGTVRDLEASQWKKVSRARAGDVLVWEPVLQGKEPHPHIGFSLGGTRALSNDFTRGVPAVHHATYNGKRKVIVIYRHEAL